MESMHAGLQMMLDRAELLKALRQFKRGDFTVRMPLNLTGIDGEIAQAFNDVVELEEAKAAEIARNSRQLCVAIKQFPEARRFGRQLEGSLRRARSD